MYLKIWILFLCFFSLSHCKYNGESNLNPIVKNGMIDLSNIHFDDQTSIPLSGDWEFHWNTFVTPVSIQSPIQSTVLTNTLAPENEKEYLGIGKRWKDIHFGKGYATYQVKLILPETSNKNIFAVRFFQTGGAAMRVFVNGKESLTLGKVGIDKTSMEPTRSSGILIIPNPTNVVNLMVHISNFHHDDGSFWYAPKFGLYKNIQNNFIKELALDALLSGALFFMAFYHFVLFFFRRTKKLILFFGLFSITTALHSLSLNGDVLYYLIPSISYRIAFSLSLIFYLAMPFYLYFLSELFPSQFSKPILRVFSTICFLLYLFVILAPTELGSQTTFIGLVFSILGLVYSAICLFRSALKKEALSIILFLIQVFLLFSAINDTLYLYGIFQYALILKYSYLSTVLFQSLLLASFFTKTFIKNETLKNELSALNESLEQTVILRTKDYKEAKQNAEEANKWKDKFISLVAHDLRSPLSTVYSALMLTNDADTTEEDKKHIFKQVYTILENAMSTVEHLLNLNRFQIDKGQIRLNLSNHFINERLTQVIESFSFDLQKKSLVIENSIPDTAQVYADSSILLEILRNLVANAIKFSHPQGKIQFSFSETTDTSIIAIKDRGTGISTEQQKLLFNEPMSLPGTMGEKGFGIGLKLCFELMRLHNGNIQVESESDQGSSFLLEFPRKKSNQD
ncbi:histidine kinase [Leptospira bouyouniensis]|uniref:histidine kinase n=1 Tax=Leptospira bouyouniensis TaxID=2484911 RepID=A0ABY2LB69_9LEPT|nr:histidine kinase [Leptospira bouyouniensis]